MSHYTVAVFTTEDGQSVSDLLAPYDVGIQVAPYVKQTRAQLIQDARDVVQLEFKGRYAEWRKDPEKYEAVCQNPEHIAYLKTIPGRLKWTDDQLYQEAIKHCESDALDSEGGLLTTCNPNSKWAGYVIGGFWDDLLLLKTKIRRNSALASEVDFQAMRDERIAKLPLYVEAMKNSFIKEKYIRERFPSEEEYIKLETSFYTYAVITPNGVWYAPGDVCWGGTSSETPVEERKWILSYHERFIKPAIEKGWRITIVDCRI